MTTARGVAISAALARIDEVAPALSQAVRVEIAKARRREQRMRVLLRAAEAREQAAQVRILHLVVSALQGFPEALAAVADRLGAPAERPVPAELCDEAEVDEELKRNQRR